MDVNTLPEVEIVNADKQKVVAYLMEVYTAVTGRTLAKSDPVRLFILVIASVVIMLLNKINYTGKQNLLKYAEGNNLDNLVALLGVTRIPGASATLTERFSLANVVSFNVTVPKGTRVSNGSQIYFATDETLVIRAGQTSGSVKCTCQESGVSGNGMTAGTVTTIVDVSPYIASAVNTTTSEGGADEEDDETLRVRAEEAPESFSTAGATGAYEYFAKAASSLIDQAKAVSPEPGSVDVYIVEGGGKLPGEELQNAVLAYLSDETRRPLTDKVVVKVPETTNYDINMTYYLGSGIDTENTRRKVELAVTDYITWQDSKMGRDINPDKLIQLCLTAGAKRVEIAAPVFTKIKDGISDDKYKIGIAKNGGSNTVNYGGIEYE
ncbi:baseplate J/gp47 family protein [uncultured Megasphaera sp.]|uniref:baseplate assembly protein n=1 Tax=uncultured Megasphaera sp. TaxID=165188 RepID=UPI00266DA1E5|nr:baseplate J/gp47 family protein [uncultured Megasphaera sp.]